MECVLLSLSVEILAGLDGAKLNFNFFSSVEGEGCGFGGSIEEPYCKKVCCVLPRHGFEQHAWSLEF